MAEKTFQTYEWIIENFSCWKESVHGEFIESPKFAQHGYIERIKLYPRNEKPQHPITIPFGVPYDNSHKNIHIKYFVANSAHLKKNMSGCMSVIIADGSQISNVSLHSSSYNKDFSTTLACSFEQVATIFKKMITQCKDRLTIRLKFSSEESYVDSVNTTLEAVKISLNIDTQLIKSMESEDSKYISIIRYNKKCYLDEFLLKATRNDKTIKFILHLLTKSANGVSVESQWSLHKSDNTLIRDENNSFLFSDCVPWTFSNSLKITEVTGDVDICLSLKIINGNIQDNSMPSNDTLPKENIYFFNQNSTNSVSTSALASDLMCLYQDQKFSDLTLKCDSVSFPVHRAILSARSPVFDRLLSSDMEEAASGTVTITDLEPATLSYFLAFLYTGAVDDLHQGENALNLYYVADKYHVTTLKKECSAFLCGNVTLSNVCQVLTLAYQHQDEELTSAVHGFIAKNYSAVLGSEKWRNFLKVQPLIAAETLTDLAAKPSVW